MITLHTLANTTRKYKRRKLLGRGVGSKSGKTSGRGQKGMGARSGYKRRLGYIGGGVPLHRRMPTRGFSNHRFAKYIYAINLAEVEALFQEGETVSLETLREKRYVKGKPCGLKILGQGELKKTVSFRVEEISKGARGKLENSKSEIHLSC